MDGYVRLCVTGVTGVTGVTSVAGVPDGPDARDVPGGPARVSPQRRVPDPGRPVSCAVRVGPDPGSDAHEVRREMPTVLLCVHGMRNAGDEARVEHALRAEPGVYGAVANHQERCAEVDCDDGEVTIDRLIRVVEDAGFGAVLGG